MTNDGFESLHNHTIRSDGNQDYRQLLRTAERNGIDVVALTDHDVALDQSSLDDLRTYDGPVKWISGIEISAKVPAECASENAGMLHILGLFINPFNDRLQEYTQQLADSRYERMQNYVAHLRNLGFAISEADCLQAAGSSPIASPHITQAIRNHPENQIVIDRMYADLQEDAKRSERSQELMQRLRDHGQGQLPYILFMKKDSFYPFQSHGRNNIILDLDDTVTLIHQADGIAVLAHWYFNKADVPADALEELADAGRIDGLELAVENESTEYDLSNDVAFLRDMAHRYNMATTVGSDSHNREDLEFFADTQTAHDSIGQTKQLIDAFDVSLEWTNFDHEDL